MLGFFPKKRAGLAALLIAVSACAQTPPASVSGWTASVLLSVEGKVEVAAAGNTNWMVARTNQVLQVGDRLRTGLRSRAAIRLSDKSVLRVNELTTLKLQPPPRDSNAPVLDLGSGSTYFFSREKPAAIEFRTPLASGAIRGTEFDLAVAEDGRTALALLDGLVSLGNERGQLELKTGELGVVEPGKAPGKTAVIDAINIIQWCLYYPGVVDADDLGLSPDVQQALSQSLAAYRSGDLLQALAQYPEDRQPQSDPERIYRAAVLLAVGQVTQTEAQLKELQSPSALADALREVIAAVKFQPWNRVAPPASATEWLAESYYLQSRSRLEAAFQAAKTATEKSPNFGFVWARAAELEFSFGRTPEALAALENALRLSPRNAEAVSLKGFLLAAQNRTRAALQQFDDAIAIDPALANAWLGRGLCRIREGRAGAGRQDLQVAAALEPNRSLLRSYLAKAFDHAGDDRLARKDLELAKRLDPNDPTPWLYSALLNQQDNQINDAARDLEKSKELNDNRSVFRSKLLLDEDRAVRSANLAAIYRDAGMTDVSVREAGRAVNDDYANYSAHLFLANSYDALRDPKLVNLRYETPWMDELLVANLLAPVGASTLSRHVSQQEYARLFEGDHLGAGSQSQYWSRGAWSATASQYGTLGNFGYSLDYDYLVDPGQRPNNDFESLGLTARFKEQVTPSDMVYLEAQYNHYDFGDVAQYYNQYGALTNFLAPSLTLRVTESQEPNIYAGFHHEWDPGIHTLFLAARLNDTFTLSDASAQILFPRYTGNTVSAIRSEAFAENLRRELEAYSFEAQQLWNLSSHSIVAGARFQIGSADTTADETRLLGAPFVQNVRGDLQRISVYGYDQWQIIDSLRLTAGVSYDRLDYPRNLDIAPITDAQTSRDSVAPKAGAIWTPLKDTHLRAYYTRSLGGVYFDNSVRLEPTQLAGFNQVYRSLIPESVVGLAPGTRFEAWGAGADRTFRTGTYLGIEGEMRNSDAERTVGVFTNSTGFPLPDSPSSTRQTLNYDEKILTVTLNQLVNEAWSLGARYQLTHANLRGRLVDIPASATGASGVNQDDTAILHQVNLFVIYNLPSGFFSQFDAVWSQQSNRGYTPDIPGDDFWQYNAYVGYRFHHRRAEFKIGLLNFSDRDYRLNPLTLYAELPRERTLLASFKFYF